MNKTIIAVSGATVVGLVVFLLIQFSNVSVKKDGVTVEVGGTTVEAGCYQDGPSCLPAFDLTDVSGKTWSRQSLEGKVVVINFWATWCAPCKAEIPDLAKVQRKYKERGVVILGLITDQPGDAKLKAFSDRYGLDYPVVRVNREISQAFGAPDRLPTNFIYNRNGHLMVEKYGAISAGALEQEIREFL